MLFCPPCLTSPLQSLLCRALLSYNMAAVYLQQGDAASPYSSQTTGSHHTGELSTIRAPTAPTARHKVGSKQTFSGQQRKYTASSQLGREPPS